MVVHFFCFIFSNDFPAWQQAQVSQGKKRNLEDAVVTEEVKNSRSLPLQPVWPWMDTQDETSQTSFLMTPPLLFRFLLSTTAQSTRKVTLRKP